MTVSNLFLFFFCIFAAELHPAATDFGRHTLIKPRIYHGREKRQISTTKEEVRVTLDFIYVVEEQKRDYENGDRNRCSVYIYIYILEFLMRSLLIGFELLF